MLRFAGIFFLCLMTIPAFSQTALKYQVDTITQVKIHQAAEKVGASDAASYDVSVRVGDTIYVVLYPPRLREETVKYAAGRGLLVFNGKSTIRYNDLLRQSYEVPIESQTPASNPAASKPVSHEAQ